MTRRAAPLRPAAQAEGAAPAADSSTGSGAASSAERWINRLVLRGRGAACASRDIEYSDLAACP